MQSRFKEAADQIKTFPLCNTVIPYRLFCHINSSTRIKDNVTGALQKLDIGARQPVYIC